jgi:hypothetical protein
MTENEVEHIFKYVTKTIRSVGVTISMNMFSDKVYYAVDALLIEKMKDSVFRSMRTLTELFTKHDSNKDGLLEFQELENLLLDC